MAGTSDEWAARAARHLKAELKRAGVSYADLASRLTALGISETETSVAAKVNRGGVSGMVPDSGNAGHWRARIAAGALILAAILICYRVSTKDRDAGEGQAPAAQANQQPSLVVSPRGAFENDRYCENTKGDKYQTDCESWQSMVAAERQASWAAWNWYLGAAGTIFVLLTLYYTKRAAEAAWHATGIAEKALTDLERPFLCAVVTKRGIDSIEKADTWDTQVKFDLSDMELSICNYGRTPAILTRLEWEITTAPVGEACRAIDPQAIGGREMPAGAISAPGAPFTEIGMPHGILWHGREDIEKLRRIIWVLGFIRYSDVLGGNHIAGFAMTFDFEIMRFVASGGVSHNYTRKEKASEIPPPSTTK